MAGQIHAAGGVNVQINAQEQNAQGQTTYRNHGQEVSAAAHQGIHGQDLAEIARGDETLDQETKEQDDDGGNAAQAKAAPADAGAQAADAGAQAAAAAAAPVDAGAQAGLQQFLTNIMNEIKAFLQKLQGGAQAAAPAQDAGAVAPVNNA